MITTMDVFVLYQWKLHEFNFTWFFTFTRRLHSDCPASSIYIWSDMYGAHRLRSMFSRKCPENELGNNKLARLRRPRKMAILTSIRSSIKVLQSSSSLKFRNIFNIPRKNIYLRSLETMQWPKWKVWSGRGVCQFKVTLNKR